MNPVPKLVPGNAFHLEGDGHWDVQRLPDEVIGTAEYIGEIKILGYPASVFEMPDGDQWAMKAPGTPAPKEDQAVEPILSSVNEPWWIVRAAARVAFGRTSRVKLEPSQIRSVHEMMDELDASEKAMGRACQFGRLLRTEQSLEWIPDQLDASLEQVRELRKGVKESLEYVLRVELED